MYRWTQDKIERWATATFGPGTALGSAARGSVEYAELLNDLGNGMDPLLTQLLQANMQLAEAICTRANELQVLSTTTKLVPGLWHAEGRGKECPDVLVMLRQTAERCGVRLDEETDAKMDINEKRTWGKLPSGRFQHA